MPEGGGLPNLRRLRLAKGMTQAQLAEAAGIARLTYRKIESGESIPKVSTLQKIAGALGVKLQDLLVPVEIPKAVRFRAKKRMKTRDKILDDVARWLKDFTDLETRLGERVEYRLQSLAEALRGQKPGKERVINAAGEARKEMGLDEDEPIRDICGLLEVNGIKVYAISIASDDFFGLSVAACDGGPAIIVNVWDRIPIERRIFTAAHELGHLLLHSNAYDVTKTEEDMGEEGEANAFAGYFLMPESIFNKEWNNTLGLLLTDRVFKVKRIFHVSYKTVLYRLQDRMGKDIWEKFQFEYRRKYGRTIGGKEEPEPLAGPDFVPERLAKLVRLGIEREAISISRGAEILRVGVDEMHDWVASWV